ncbi:MAG: RHS repeat domain-containing protein [Spirosomataceae bacterium]
MVRHPSGFIKNLQSTEYQTGRQNGDIHGANIVSTQKITEGKYKAENQITLLPGFEATAHDAFSAEIKPQSPQYQWQYVLADHLGNVRVIFADKNNDGLIAQSVNDTINEILSIRNYSPFGLELGGSHKNLDYQNPYRFGGKEVDAFSSYLDFGGRWYDSNRSGWNQVDPLAEHPNQVSRSTYSAFWSNPITYNDPDGRCPICPFLAKGLTGAGIDYMLQGAMNYAGGMGLSDAFSSSNVDMSNVAISGAQGMLPWRVPGGKYGKAAGVAFSDVMINYGKSLVNGTDYSNEQMGQDFIIGFAAQLGSEKVAEFFGDKGIVYLRKDASGNLKPYVGQAKNEKRFLERQKEHARTNPDSDFEFDVLDRGSSKGKFPTDLDKKEQKHLDKMNGPTNKSNPNGGTSNKKNVIKKK